MSPLLQQVKKTLQENKRALLEAGFMVLEVLLWILAPVHGFFRWLSAAFGVARGYKDVKHLKAELIPASI